MNVLDDWSKGDRPTAAQLQQGVDAIREVQRHSAPVQGVGESVTALRFFARIVKTGPLGTEADFADERYWVKPLYASGLATTGLLNLSDDDYTLYPDRVVAASNLVEWDVVTHTMAMDSIVEVYVIVDRNPPPGARKAHYVFHGGTHFVMVKVTGNETGGGKYVGKVWNPVKNNVSGTGNLTEAEIGTSGADCRILNAAEVGQSTHDLTSGTPKSKIFPGMVLRVNDNDLKLVVVINGTDWEACS